MSRKSPGSLKIDDFSEKQPRTNSSGGFGKCFSRCSKESSNGIILCDVTKVEIAPQRSEMASDNLQNAEISARTMSR